jgi:hypothetical protein
VIADYSILRHDNQWMGWNVLLTQTGLNVFEGRGLPAQTSERTLPLRYCEIIPGRAKAFLASGAHIVFYGGKYWPEGQPYASN